MSHAQLSITVGEGESVQIGNVQVNVSQLRRHKVKLVIQAPRTERILRLDREGRVLAKRIKPSRPA